MFEHFLRKFFYTQCISAICLLFSNWKLDKTLKSDKDIAASTMDRIHLNKGNRLKCWKFCRRDQILFFFFHSSGEKKTKKYRVIILLGIISNFEAMDLFWFFFRFFLRQYQMKKVFISRNNKNTFDGTFYLIKGFGQHCRLSQYETVGITW